MNIDHIRSLFPVTEHAIYLNNASHSPLNNLMHEKLLHVLKTDLNPVGKKPFDRNAPKVLLSKILGGLPQEYALVTSTGVGLGIVAQGIDFKAGDNVVLPEKEHWNNSFPWLALERKGVEIRFAKLDANQRLAPESIREMVDAKTRVVSVAAVRYNSGFRPKLKEIGKIAHEHGALFVVDVAQAAGIIPIAVEDDGIDIMAGCGFKWLMGFQGTGFLYVKKEVMAQVNPVLPGMYAAKTEDDQLSYYPDARKFETGTIANALFEAWCAGLELVNEIGVQKIYEMALSNTDLLINGILKKGYQLITPVGERLERSAIVIFSAATTQSTTSIYDELISKNVLVTLQGDHIRVSPNFFNTKADIDQFLDVI